MKCFNFSILSLHFKANCIYRNWHSLTNICLKSCVFQQYILYSCFFLVLYNFLSPDIAHFSVFSDYLEFILHCTIGFFRALIIDKNNNKRTLFWYLSTIVTITLAPYLVLIVTIISFQNLNQFPIFCSTIFLFPSVPVALMSLLLIFTAPVRPPITTGLDSDLRNILSLQHDPAFLSFGSCQ